jgi:hypothetical protein
LAQKAIYRRGFTTFLQTFDLPLTTFRGRRQSNGMKRILPTFGLLTLFFSMDSVLAAEQIQNPLIDYKEFQKIVAASASERESHRLTEPQFINAMVDKKAVLLDARSASLTAFDRLLIGIDGNRNLQNVLRKRETSEKEKHYVHPRNLRIKP